jgi:hypothetical protein
MGFVLRIASVSRTSDVPGLRFAVQLLLPATMDGELVQEARHRSSKASSDS